MGGAGRRRKRRAAGTGADRLLTPVLVLLALIVGAFLSSVVYRWTGGWPVVAGGGAGAAPGRPASPAGVAASARAGGAPSKPAGARGTGDLRDPSAGGAPRAAEDHPSPVSPGATAEGAGGPARGPAGPGGPPPPPAPVGGALDRARIRVEVLNAARVPGLATRMTSLLRRRGFDVVNYGNAPGVPRAETAVVDRVGNPRFAREVARELPGTPILSDLSPDRFIDVTVVVGRDYERFFAAPAPPRRAPQEGPLRRLLGRVRALLDI